jgi:hypothetical protein
MRNLDHILSLLPHFPSLLLRCQRNSVAYTLQSESHHSTAMQIHKTILPFALVLLAIISQAFGAKCNKEDPTSACLADEHESATCAFQMNCAKGLLDGRRKYRAEDHTYFMSTEEIQECRSNFKSMPFKALRTFYYLRFRDVREPKPFTEFDGKDRMFFYIALVKEAVEGYRKEYIPAGSVAGKRPPPWIVSAGDERCVLDWVSDARAGIW